VKNLPRSHGLGISVLSTPKGIMADNAARDENVGGEIPSRCSSAHSGMRTGFSMTFFYGEAVSTSPENATERKRAMSRIGKRP